MYKYYYDEDERDQYCRDAQLPYRSQVTKPIFHFLQSFPSRMQSRQAAPKPDRKTVERNRRLQMKTLYAKLASLLAKHKSPKERLSPQHSLEQATIYIKNLQEKINKMKEKKDLILAKIKGKNKDTTAGLILGLRSPVVEITDSGSSLTVVLIIGFCNKLILSDAICVLEEEGVEVLNASFSTFGDKIIYIIHSQVTSSRVGCDTNRLYQRLKELVH